MSHPIPELELLAECRTPLLIGVRHHSAALSQAMPALLERFQPEVLLLELPVEFAEWIDHLADAQLQAPVALAGVSEAGDDLSFYPLADFSPELAAVRWARAHDIEVRPCDLPLAQRRGAVDRDVGAPTGLLQRILRRTHSENVGQLWDRLVETPAAGCDAESVRRAALLFGWALRSNDQQASLYDRRREAHMRQCIAQVSGRCAAVVGSYHAAALLPEPVLWSPPENDPANAPPEDAPPEDAPRQISTAMIPYSFSQLDERSGYPAGVLDPAWHDRAFRASTAEQRDQLVADMAVGVCRQLREQGHAAGAADCLEVVRMTRDLARMRGFPAPGRGEFLEAVQCCLTQGQLLGRGSAVAQAMEHVLVGRRRGQLPAGAPQSGLATDVRCLLKDLKLPDEAAAGEDPKRLRLDPLRSKLDRARVVLLERLAACGISYGAPVDSQQDALRESLTEVWDVQWQHATAAMLELTATLGATLHQAARGAVRRVLEGSEEESTAARLQYLLRCARCGLTSEVEQGLGRLTGDFLLDAGLGELSDAIALIERVRRGHEPGLPLEQDQTWSGVVFEFAMPKDIHAAPFLQAAIGRLEGLAGSDDWRDVQAVLDLVLTFQQRQLDEPALDAGRLLWILGNMSRDGSPMMQGASTAARLLLGDLADEQFGLQLGSWVDAAVDRDSLRTLSKRLGGAALASLPRWISDPSCLDGLEVRVAALDDKAFLKRLSALRGGFHVLAPAARERLLQDLLQRLPEEQAGAGGAIDDPELAALRTAADDAGRRAVLAWMPDLQLTTSLQAPQDPVASRPLTAAGSQVSLANRWRLMLGAPRESMTGVCRRAAQALDELYGHGQGEGQRGDLAGPGGGREEAFPTVRRWSEELESLFGSDVREEVLAEAAAEGRAAALDELDPDHVTPSVGLLEQVLSLRGSLPPGREEHLRRLAGRVTEQLARQLASRLQPALAGLSVPRPTRRRTQRLDLGRTIRANLRTAHSDEQGRTQLIPEQLYFRSRARRAMDWHLIFVVDVSGSMEASVIYSALVSAIFNALPALSIRFLAFSTEVIDFSDQVDDPLSLLLEVEVGGGTHIARALRAARQQVRVPSRTIVLLVSDFEEGWPVGKLLAEVEALRDTGCRMLGLAALSDVGQPRYNQGIAQRVAARGMPVAALSPLRLAQWVGDQIR